MAGVVHSRVTVGESGALAPGGRNPLRGQDLRELTLPARPAKNRYFPNRYAESCHMATAAPLSATPTQPNMLAVTNRRCPLSERSCLSAQKSLPNCPWPGALAPGGPDPAKGSVLRELTLPARRLLLCSEPRPFPEHLTRLSRPHDLGYNPPALLRTRGGTEQREERA